MPEKIFKVPEVNLLPGDDLTGRPGGIFLAWALTWGRRIVVTTELIVILAFLSRFWFDTEVANLTEQIDERKVIVVSAQEFENKFRTLSSRLAKAEAIEKSLSPLTVYEETKKLIPIGVTVSQIAVSPSSIGISASSDELSLGKMVDAFKTSSKFSDLVVERVSAGKDPGIVNFSLRAGFVISSTQND
jgi:hypothetical protein